MSLARKSQAGPGVEVERRAIHPLDVHQTGAMDGFLRSGSNDEFAIGYYTEADLSFYSALAQNYTTLDRYFCTQPKGPR